MVSAGTHARPIVKHPSKVNSKEAGLIRGVGRRKSHVGTGRESTASPGREHGEGGT